MSCPGPDVEQALRKCVENGRASTQWKSRIQPEFFLFFSLGIICFLNYTPISLSPSYSPLNTVHMCWYVCLYICVCIYVICIYILHTYIYMNIDLEYLCVCTWVYTYVHVRIYPRLLNTISSQKVNWAEPSCLSMLLETGGEPVR